jgi:hypothetical protein
MALIDHQSTAAAPTARGQPSSDERRRQVGSPHHPSGPTSIVLGYLTGDAPDQEIPRPAEPALRSALDRRG